jgi:IS605 OrfB family transposase
MKVHGSLVLKDSKQDNPLGLSTLTLHLRMKDKHAGFLRAQAREVNFVWNYSQDLALQVLRREKRFMSAYDMAPFTKGASKEGISLHSQTIQGVSEEYCLKRKQFKRTKLRWRASYGKKRSLGWIPFKESAITYRNGQVIYQGKPLSLWDSYGLKSYELGSGSICEDARGRWYLNVTVKVAQWSTNPEYQEDTQENGVPRTAVGIDLGLKDLLVASNGYKVQTEQFYRKAEEQLAVAQRANKKSRVKAIHAKVANKRKDMNHKESTALVRQHSAIFVGNVSSSGLAKTSMAKSVLDAGWSQLRTMIKYKCDNAGVWFDEVNESYSTQECSCCGSRTGPKGSEGLSIRTWECSVCNTLHDRDTNSATVIRNRGLLELHEILRTTGSALEQSVVANEAVCGKRTAGVGHGPLAVGILVC